MELSILDRLNIIEAQLSQPNPQDDIYEYSRAKTNAHNIVSKIERIQTEIGISHTPIEVNKKL